MRKLGLVMLPVWVMGVVAVSAQGINEAYDLSGTTVQGTARSMGFGNALGSVGGDFSSVSANPAGLGVYRSSEITFTPSLRINATSSQYQGTSTDDNNTHFNVNNFGFVFTNAPKGRRYDHRNWKSVAFALGMNRIADFNRNYTYQGINQTSSGSEVFESDANLNPTGASAAHSNTLGAMGYNSYLLNQNTSGQYYSIVPTGNLNQIKSSQENGGINEYTISLGGNYKEKLLLGIAIGIPVVNYQDNYYYAESTAGNNGANAYGFNSFTYNQQLMLSGAGINSTIGAIYKITDFFRIGAALHTPTYYSLSESSNPFLTTTHNDTTAGAGYRFHDRDYNLTTPWKGVLSATFVVKNFGFITADYEYVDYGSMRYELPGGMDYSSGVSFQQEQDSINQVIKNTFKGVSDFRLGGEFKVTKYFMARLGFGYYGNAYTSYGESMANSYYTTNRIDLSAGIGFHFNHFFTDLAIVHSMYQGYTEPYTINPNGLLAGQSDVAPQAKIDYSINNIALTMGVKF